MRNQLYIILFISAFLSGNSQSNFQKFNKLSSAKKWWVIFHPFKAKKALKISLEANRVSDSIRHTNLLDRDHAGGQVDAFRHAYWMARLKEEIGTRAARSLGKSHEKDNHKMFKKRKLEEGVLPDEISSEMDLYNNEIGLSLTSKGIKTPKKGLIYRVINAITAGKMKIIKKDKKGRFLTCNSLIIKSSALKGKWKNDKCLVNSNYQR